VFSVYLATLWNAGRNGSLKLLLGGFQFSTSGSTSHKDQSSSLFSLHSPTSCARWLHFSLLRRNTELPGEWRLYFFSRAPSFNFCLNFKEFSKLLALTTWSLNLTSHFVKSHTSLKILILKQVRTLGRCDKMSFCGPKYSFCLKMT